MLDSATSATSEVLGGLTIESSIYGRGGRIRTDDHLNPILRVGVINGSFSFNRGKKSYKW